MALLQYDFRVVGAQNVERSIMSLERRFIASNQRMMREMSRPMPAMRGGGAVMRPGGGPGATVAWGGAGRRGVSETERLAMRVAREQANEEIRQVRRVAREKELAERHVARIRDRHFATEQRNQERETRQRRAERQASFRGHLGTAGQSLGGMLGTATRFAGMAAGLGGGLALADTLGHTMRANASATTLALEAQGTAAAGGKTAEQLRSEIKATAKSNALRFGFDSETVLAGMGAFHERGGDIQATQRATPLALELANISGADPTEILMSMGTAFESLTKRGLNMEDALGAIEKVMLGVAGQSKTGSIGLKNLGGILGDLALKAGRFEGDAGTNILKMTGLAQIAGLATAGETSTAVERFTDNLLRMTKLKPHELRQKGLGGLKLQETAGGPLRDPFELIPELLSRVGGDIAKLMGDGLFEQEGLKVIEKLGGVYSSTKGTDEEKKAAVKKLMMDQLAMSMSPEALREGSALRMGDTDKRWAQLQEEFAQEVGPAMLDVFRQLIPVMRGLIPFAKEFAKTLPDMMRGLAKMVETLAPAIEVAVEKFGWLGEQFAKSPLLTLGAIIAAKLTADIAAAAIGEAIKNAILGNLGGGGVATQLLAAASGLSAAGALLAVGAGALIGGAMAFFANAADKAERERAERKKQGLGGPNGEWIAHGGMQHPDEWKFGSDFMSRSPENRQSYLDMLLGTTEQSTPAHETPAATSPYAPSDPLAGMDTGLVVEMYQATAEAQRESAAAARKMQAAATHLLKVQGFTGDLTKDPLHRGYDPTAPNP